MKTLNRFLVESSDKESQPHTKIVNFIYSLFEKVELHSIVDGYRNFPNGKIVRFSIEPPDLDFVQIHVINPDFNDVSTICYIWLRGHPDVELKNEAVIKDSIKRQLEGNDRLKIDLFVFPHSGFISNFSLANECVKKIRSSCRVSPVKDYTQKLKGFFEKEKNNG